MIKITFLSLFVLAGCGGSAQLTCEYLEDQTNCWAEAAAAAKACLPEPDDNGVLATKAISGLFKGTSSSSAQKALPYPKQRQNNIDKTVKHTRFMGSP